MQSRQIFLYISHNSIAITVKTVNAEEHKVIKHTFLLLREQLFNEVAVVVEVGDHRVNSQSRFNQH